MHQLIIEFNDELTESRCFVTETLYNLIKDVPDFTIRSKHGAIVVDISNKELIKKLDDVENKKLNDPEYNLNYLEGGVTP